MSEVADIYTKLMAPGFVDALQDPGALVSDGDSFYDRLIAAQTAIRTQLQKVDWESSGLPDKSFGSDDTYHEAPVPPRDYANRLMVFALEDVMLPFELSAAYAESHQVTAPIGQLLRDSRANLIKIARMVDDDKSHLYTVIKHRTNPAYQEVADAFGDPKFTGDAVVLDQPGRALDWNPDIRNWIEARLYPDRGCPAVRFAIQAAGQKTTLTNYFWDQMTRILYPE